jgi:uncharacterized protein (DUF433 family)
MVTILSIDTIISDPALRGGRPVIAGTTLRVSDVAAYHIFSGFTPEDIAVQFRLTMGQVYAALAYYYMHKAEIDAEIRANAEEAGMWRRRLSDQEGPKAFE